MKLMKKTPMAAAILMLAIGTAHAAQNATYNAINTINNNFTMIDSINGLIGGSNRVAFGWDGTTFDSSSDYTGPGGASNATASSPDVFNGALWVAHTIQIFGPGSYDFDTSLLNDGSNIESGLLHMDVGPNQLGAHMLFHWGNSALTSCGKANCNIDVAIVWNLDSTFAGPMYTANNPANNSTSTVFLLSSMDANGDGILGIPMPPGGPFAGSNANFNFKGPLAFTFSDQSGVALNTVIESAPITVTSLGTNAGNNAVITVSGGEYAVSTDGGTIYGAYTSAASTVAGVAGNSLNDKIKVKVRHTSSASNSTTTDTTLRIGLHSDIFTSTTVAAVPVVDTTPDAFNFTSKTDVAFSTVIESDPVTISGINTATDISVSGGEYAISTNGGTSYGAYTASAGIGAISNGYMIKARHTSAAANSTNTVTTVTVGGVSRTFTSTTLAAAGIDSFPSTAAEPSGMSGSGCSISSEASTGIDRGDWWLVAGFLTWLGALRMRLKRQA